MAEKFHNGTEEVKGGRSGNLKRLISQRHDMTYILFLKNNGTNEINENLYLNYFSACACIQTHTHTHTHTHTQTQFPEHNYLFHVEWKLKLSQFPIKISLLQLFFRIDKYTASCTPRQYFKFLFLRSCFHSFCHAWGYSSRQNSCCVLYLLWRP